MSNLSDLHPCFAPVWSRVLADGQAQLDVKYPGSKVQTTVTIRPLSDQVAAKAAGLSDVSIGYHQVGLAVDYAIITPEGLYVSDGADPRYALIGGIALDHGCHYPIILSNGKPDYDHVQAISMHITDYLSWAWAHPLPVMT